MAGSLLMLKQGIPTRIPIGFDDSTSTLDFSLVSSYVWPSGGLPFGGVRLTGVGDPLDLQDASTKAYVDNAFTVLPWKDSVAVFNMLSDQDMGGVPPASHLDGDAYVVNNWGGSYNDGDIVVWNASWKVVIPNVSGEPPDGVRVLVCGDHGTGSGSFAGGDKKAATYDASSSSWTFEDSSLSDLRFVYGSNDPFQGAIYAYNGSAWVAVAGGGGLVPHATTHEVGGSDEIDVTDLSGRLADPQDADSLQGNPVSSAVPNVGDLLTWDGTAWVPQAAGASSAFDRVYNYAGALALRDAVYISGPDTVSQADASDVLKMPAIGFVVSIIDGTTCVVRDGGSLGGFSGLSPGELYYVSATSPGKITMTPPDPGVINQCCIAITSDEIRIHIDLDYLAAPAP